MHDSVTIRALPLPRWVCAVITGICAVAAATANAAGQELTLSDAVRMLKAEAAEARASGIIPVAADFAQRNQARLPAEQVQLVLLSPADRDPFIDAYIRWQMTSFQPPLTLTQRDFQHLLRSAPAMVINPRADAPLMELLQRAADAGPLSQTDTQKLQQISEQLDERTAAAELLNRPAREFRQWIADSHVVSSDSLRSLQWLLEECVATIDAAWSTRSVKMRMSRALSASADDPALTNDDRRTIANQLAALAGRSSRFVNEITFFADQTVTVTYSTAAVTERDVERWLQRMAGQE